MKFKQFIDEQQITDYKVESLLNAFIVLDEMNDEGSMIDDSMLDEGIFDMLNNFANKVGLEIEKTDGIIQNIKKFSSTGGKMIIAAIKGDKEKIKKLSTEIDKSDFLKFVYNLDILTMHFITGPIHLIAAVTGWELQIKTPEIAVKAYDMIWNGISNLKDGIAKAIQSKNKQTRLLGFVKNIEKNVPLKPLKLKS